MVGAEFDLFDEEGEVALGNINVTAEVSPNTTWAGRGGD